MRLLRILPERWQQLVPELTKFAAIGLVNTVVDFAIYNALLKVGPIKASAAAMVVATTVSYLLNRYWTFAHRERGTAQQEYILFFALNFVGFLIQTAPVAFAKYGMHFSEDGTMADVIAFNIAKVIGIGFGMLFRFWSYRKYVFKAPKQQPAEVNAELAVASRPVPPHVVPAHVVPSQAVALISHTAAEQVAPVSPAPAPAPAGGNRSPDNTDAAIAELLIDEALYGGEPTRTAG